jgi:hypothetical protein
MKMTALGLGLALILSGLQLTAPQLTARFAVRADDAPPLTAQEKSLAGHLTAEAKRMIAEYPNTRYTHKTHIDRSQGICEVDCSGFIVTLLRHKSPKHLESINTAHKRPLAEDFVTAFAPKQGAPARGWKRVDRVADARAGDVLAWMKLDRVEGDNTGHVMLVAAKPVAESPERFRVRIYDSTLHGHASDERTNTGRSGIGEGTLWLDVDHQGRPIGYRWKSRTGNLHNAPIAIGRAVPLD